MQEGDRQWLIGHTTGQQHIENALLVFQYVFTRFNSRFQTEVGIRRSLVCDCSENTICQDSSELRMAEKPKESEIPAKADAPKGKSSKRKDHQRVKKFTAKVGTKVAKEETFKRGAFPGVFPAGPSPPRTTVEVDFQLTSQRELCHQSFDALRRTINGAKWLAELQVTAQQVLQHLHCTWHASSSTTRLHFGEDLRRIIGLDRPRWHVRHLSSASCQNRS